MTLIGFQGVSPVGAPARRFLAVALLTGTVIGAAQGPAFGQGDDAVNRFIAEIEKAGAKVAVGRRTADATARAVDLADVVVTIPAAPPRPELQVTVPRLRLEGIGSDGGFTTTARIEVPGLTARTVDGTESLSVGPVAVVGLRYPGAAAPAGNPAKPFTTRVARFKHALQASVDSVSIGPATYEIRSPAGTTAGLSWKAAGLDRFVAGKLDRLRLEGLSVASGPAAARSELSTPAVELRGLDLDPYVRLFDDTAYQGGRGDPQWRPLFATLTVDAPRLAQGAASVTAEAASVSGLRLRQAPQPFGALMDRMETDPKAVAQDQSASMQLSMSLLESIGLERLSVRAVSATGFGPATFSLQSGDMVGLAIDSLGEFTLRGGRIEDPAGRIGFEILSLGRLKLPSLGTLQEATAAQRAGTPLPASRLTPSLGSVRVEKVAIDPKNAPRFGIGLVSIDAEDYVGPVPSKILATIRQLDLPAGPATTGLGKTLADLGFTKLLVDATLAATWTETRNELRISEFDLTVAEAGALSLSATFSGVDRRILETPAEAGQYAADIALDRLRLEYRDGSLVERGLRLWAKSVNQSPDNIRRYLLGVVQNALSPIPDQHIRRRMVEALTTFIQTPRSLTFSTQSTAPIQVPVLANLLRVAPQQVPVQLRLDAEANRWTPPSPGSLR